MKNNLIISLSILLAGLGLAFECQSMALFKSVGSKLGQFYKFGQLMNMRRFSASLKPTEKRNALAPEPIRMGEFSPLIRSIWFKLGSDDADCLVIRHVLSGQKMYLSESNYPNKKYYTPLAVPGRNNPSVSQEIGLIDWGRIARGPELTIHSDMECRVRQLPWDTDDPEKWSFKSKDMIPRIHMQCKKKPAHGINQKESSGQAEQYNFIIQRAGVDPRLAGEIEYRDKTYKDLSFSLLPRGKWVPGGWIPFQGFVSDKGGYRSDY